MRREGDLLISLVRAASTRLLLCAPFMKKGVVERLLCLASPSVQIDLVTRWIPKEIAAGVSDLDVFDLIASRPRTTLRLLDNLHAKIYLGDGGGLVGSANLTATALGWCDRPNVEMLVNVKLDDEDLRRCLVAIEDSRPATSDERTRIELLLEGVERTPAPIEEQLDRSLATVWLPRMAAPEKLRAAYHGALRERLTASSLDAADTDLAALGVPAGLSEQQFQVEVARRFSAMPAIATILEAAQSDLSDADAMDMIGKLVPDAEISQGVQWQIVREWLTHFLKDRYEIAPQSFITRLRPGAGR